MASSYCLMVDTSRIGRKERRMGIGSSATITITTNTMNRTKTTKHNFFARTNARATAKEEGAVKSNHKMKASPNCLPNQTKRGTNTSVIQT